MQNPPRQTRSSPFDTNTPELDVDDAWKLVRQLAAGTLETGDQHDRSLALDEDGNVRVANGAEALVTIDRSAPAYYRPCGPITSEARRLLDLFMPLCVGPKARGLVVAHMAQSLDGRIATISGESQFISGREDLVHTHRLRAICDAVIVGVRTCLSDDPLLTTRLVDGPSPARVVLDPRGSLPRSSRLFADASSPTLIVTSSADLQPPAEHVEVIRQNLTGDRLDLRALLRTLRDRGYPRVFVEGGGITVSHFLQESLLDRLHIAIAPTILGSGRASFALPPIDRLQDRQKLTFRQYRLGPDLLLDCELCDGPASTSP